MRQREASESSGSEREADAFRRLVRKEISADEYVRSLERRVRDQHEETENGHSSKDDAGEE